jgi:acetyltransferase-like isoleucine patch superfamily enzyme
MITAGRHTIVPEDVSCFVDLEIGSFTSIASGLRVVSGQHPPVEHPKCVSTFPFFEHGWGDYPPCKMDGKVSIGSDVWVGQDVHILEGVTIGHGAIVGACSVVTKDVLPYAVITGNPTRVKRFRFEEPMLRDLLDSEWWNWPDEIIRDSLELLADVNEMFSA